MYGNIYYSAIPAISEGDILVSDPKEKADLFNQYFVSEASVSNLESAEIPPFCRCSPNSFSKTFIARGSVEFN